MLADRILVRSHLGDQVRLAARSLEQGDNLVPRPALGGLEGGLPQTVTVGGQGSGTGFSALGKKLVPARGCPLLGQLGEPVNFPGQLADFGVVICEHLLHGGLLGGLQGIQLDTFAGDVVQSLIKFSIILNNLLVGCFSGCAYFTHCCVYVVC